MPRFSAGRRQPMPSTDPAAVSAVFPKRSTSTEVCNLDLDLELLSHLPNPDTWTVFDAEGFKRNLILDDAVADIYVWAEDHRREHGTPATAAVLADEFDLEFSEPETAIGDLITRLRQRYMKSQGRAALKGIGQQYNEDPSQVPALLLKTGRELTEVTTPRGTICAADVPLERLRWAWDNWMPVGYLALVTGVSSLGKSIFACWLISELTRGHLDGEFRGKPTKVLLVANEDGLGDMWGPRLTAAGADLQYVEYLRYPDDWAIRDGMALIDRE